MAQPLRVCERKPYCRKEKLASSPQIPRKRRISSQAPQAPTIKWACPRMCYTDANIVAHIFCRERLRLLPRLASAWRGALQVTRHSRPTGGLLAVALVLRSGFLPAAAESGSEAVVCAGSEPGTHQTNLIRRVFTQDMRGRVPIGANIGRHDQKEKQSSFGARLLSGDVARVVRSRKQSCRDHQIYGRQSPGSDRGPGELELPSLQREVRFELR